MQTFNKVILCCGLAIISLSEMLAQDCATQIVPPVLSEAARTSMEEKLATAKAAYELAPNSPDALIWYGRRTAYLGHYSEAIELYTRGMSQHPTDARLYRLGADEKAQKLLESIEPDMALIENFDYLRILLLHKGALEAAKLQEEIAQPTSLSNTTLALGLANYYYLNGRQNVCLN